MKEVKLKQSAKEFILSYFSKIGSIPGNNESEKLACDYLVTGLIDSFGVVELISKLESNYGFNFTNEDLENPKFKTIGGLIELIDSKL